MRLIQFFTLLFAIVIFPTACKIDYRPPVESPKTGYLVVEGFINCGDAPTKITLSRTTSIYNDSITDNKEHDALVSIEGSNNESYPLYESTGGVYTSQFLHLDNTEKYRLKIKTQYGKEYASDFSAYRTTPGIDSLSWLRDANGVKIYVNTHDDEHQPGYYFWKYEETWEIHSAFYSQLVYVYVPGSLDPVGVGYRNADHSADLSLYTCWPHVTSSNVNIGSSEKLSRDQIFFPIMSIESQSAKLSVLYSIKVFQYSVSKEQYDYLRILKTNSEDIGSITGPLPSQLTGNIHCLTNPSETVLGFVEMAQEKQSNRLFISNDEVPGWNYDPHCVEFSVDNDVENLKGKADLFPTLVHEIIGLGAIKSFYATRDRGCMDCTIYGSNVKPDFWP